MPVTNVNINKYYFEKPVLYVIVLSHSVSLDLLYTPRCSADQGPKFSVAPREKRVLESKCR